MILLSRVTEIDQRERPTGRVYCKGRRRGTKEYKIKDKR
jgi:hypothetical protein